MTDRLKFAATRSQQLMAVGALLAVVLPAGWWLLKEPVRSALRSFVNGSAQCVIIPYSGHNATPAAPGEWSTITWYGIERLADCGPPELTGYVINGDRILHDVELSMGGVDLPVGTHDEIRYRFRVPPGAHTGRGFFFVTINFPEAGRSINSPRVPFDITERN